MNNKKFKNIDEFGEIVNEHQASVRACIRVLGIPSGFVDDLAQETFIVAYRKFSEFDNSKSIRSWLLGIARNLVLNERRKSARRFRLLNENLTDLMQEEAVSVVEEFQAQEKLKLVKSCIENMPDRNKEVLNLKFEGGKTAASIAVKMQRDSSTIRHLLARIISGLRKCVNERESLFGS